MGIDVTNQVLLHHGRGMIKREDFSERLVMQHSNDGHVSNEKIELQGNMILELTL